jgi:uroporphyrinogen-III decarboxylase
MLSAKENFLQTIRRDGHPDRLVNQFEALGFIAGDPVAQYTRGNRVRGTTSKDRWGTTIIYPENVPAAMPHITEENKVCPDVTEWQKYVKVPDLRANCSTGWENARQQAEKIHSQGKLTISVLGTGVFEQCHYLMGFEDTLVNLLAEPESMKELIEVITEYRLTMMKLYVENLHPDVIMSHDDWGTKRSLFMSPEVWREFFKESYRKLYGYLKSEGVIVMHHADSYCQPIVEDMAEIGVDIWQGVLPENDIPEIQKILQGRMTLQGGIDACIDRVDTQEEEVIQETRRACRLYGPGGHYIPNMTYGGKGTIYPQIDEQISREIERYNQENYR